MASTFDIDSEDINVEEIMNKIKENIKKRKMQGAYSAEDEKLLNSTYAQPNNSASQLDQDLFFLNNNWNIENNSYRITSHRKFVGPILVNGRQLVHGEVKRYVDPMIWKQKEFNNILARTLSNLTKDTDDKLNSVKIEINSITEEKVNNTKSDLVLDIDKKIADMQADIKSNIQAETNRVDSDITLLNRSIKSVDEKVERLKCEVNDLIDDRVNKAVSAINNDINSKVSLSNILTCKINNSMKIHSNSPKNENKENKLNYLIFEDKFRGSSKSIIEKQSTFLEYFKECNNVLDIGCGRGEFLKVLKDNGISAHGIDINDDMVDYCLSKGLDVKKIDAITYLETLADKTLDGIFIDQVIEHLEPQYLMKLLELCNKKLKYGYYIVIETINPLSFISLANFYIDVSHIKPVHPETLKFLMEYFNFRETSIHFYAPLSDDTRLRKVPILPDSTDQQKAVYEIYNHNIEKLNNILYGPQDYAVIAKK